MSNRVFSAFVKLAVLSLFVVSGAAAGCGSGGSAGSPAGTGGSAAGGGAGGSASGGSTGIVSCTSGGAEITSLPACAGGGASSAVDVPAGCTPTIDGSLHQEEWSDAACFTVASGNMIVNIKYSGDSVYMATSGAPTCGCGMPFEFDPDGTGAANGNEFAISVFDDPFGTNGDRSNFVLQNGAFVAGTVPTGVVVMCPGSQPSPIRYEWKIPFAALGITAGSPHSYRQAIIHSSAHWPDTLVVTSGVAVDPTNWGQMSSSRNWK